MENRVLYLGKFPEFGNYGVVTQNNILSYGLHAEILKGK